MKKINDFTIQKLKKSYIDNSLWSNDIKDIIKTLDFSIVITSRYKIPEHIVKFNLVEKLKTLQFQPFNILDIVINNQNKKLSEISKFFKNYIFNDIFFRQTIIDICEKLNCSVKEDNCPEIVSYIANKYHKCKMCNNLTTTIYCSSQCMGNDPEYKERYIKNMGSLNANLKRQKTCIEKYGDINVLGKNSSITAEIKTSNIIKYGGENVMNKKSPIRKIAEDTMLKKYGVKYFNNKEKRIQTNLKNLGIEYSTQSNFKNFENLNYEYVKEHFVDIKHDRFLFDEFKTFFNLSQTVAYRYKNKFGFQMPSKHKRLSMPQKELFDFIQDSSKLFNDRTLLKPLELDIVIPNKNLAIEYDGVYWHCLKNNSKIHLTKTELCEEKGYQLFHIFDSDDIDVWKSMINAKLGICITKVYARKCVLKEITSNQSKMFCDINHLQGGIDSKINLGLFNDDKLVAVMTFSKPRFNKKYDWELIRYCQLKNYRVVGGAGKLLKYFRSNFKGSIISYANRRWSNGNLYKKLGFSFIRNTVPNFVYSKNGKIYSRISMQKHKLTNLHEYDQQKTADEIIKDAGYAKLYDSGNSVWELV